MNLSKRLQRTRIYYKAFFKLMSYIIKKCISSSKRIISEIKKIDPNLSIDEYNLSYMKINYTNFVEGLIILSIDEVPIIQSITF